ncbi:hypothetical protein P168DRAFT_245288 [Aspergillus campestris IBT 28561]|uniref:Uncharacterized protein n=4 Tax=Aspergillus TaxID=5052 RepID=A0A2I2FR21_9EURO|nr:hypothetical protein P168DRAFT_245425 [Aspergillus campestris IBT 28561]PLB42827.1 hypothetical protein P170DRAFT_371390 [Aspergillus steynii IBT 23096]PTU16816.1 hypothetical protein P175DRAFT_0447627 [Aspergillus ochraceoroseus IBT 24754]PKX99809.1 hypothetical protein P168DRAFT_245282 [Aspergillus campestris IBT 28561]PKX99820.1 hypothetical protein P168DRAFT_245319 [Aspergillus campestris IBT 28561]
MHHHPKDQERALNLSILILSGPVKLSRRLHALWCPSVNFFKFQPCDHTPPRTQKL